MKKLEAVAERIAIIDKGTIVARGTTAELCKETKTKTQEEAYLQLTGKTLRDEAESGNNDGMNFKLALRNRRLR